MGVESNNFSANVFINCPYDEDYKKLLRPLMFTVVCLKLVPRIASERLDSAEFRLEKIYDLLSNSKWSIHDISRLKPNPSGGYSRLNMAFELGIDFGVREFGENNHHSKKILVLAENEHDYKIALSDISGSDIKHHKNDPREIVRAVRNWLYDTAGIEKAPSPNIIWNGFGEFSIYLFEERKSKGGSDQDVSEDIERMPVLEFINKASEWVKDFPTN